MNADARLFVQFIHPGGEHHPGADGNMSWNTRAHKRKFMVANGARTRSGKEREGQLSFWGEWEPLSRVIETHPAQGNLPRFVHQPLFPATPDTFETLQNTDPFVFGDRFVYTGCQQHTNKGRTETHLRHLGAGSVIVFGSCSGETEFVIDTVFVVADAFDHRLESHKKVLAGRVAAGYWTVTLRPWYGRGEGGQTFRLYRGATADARVDGMFSFVPCLGVENGTVRRFARPAIELRERITPHLKQGRKATVLVDSSEALSVWRKVVKQVESKNLELGTRIDMPGNKAVENGDRLWNASGNLRPPAAGSE